MVSYPDVEFDIFVGDGLHIESHSGNRVHTLSQFQLVQYSGLARGIQAQHQDAHLLVPKHFRQDLAHLDHLTFSLLNTATTQSLI